MNPFMCILALTKLCNILYKLLHAQHIGSIVIRYYAMAEGTAQTRFQGKE